MQKPGNSNATSTTCCEKQPLQVVLASPDSKLEPVGSCVIDFVSGRSAGIKECSLYDLGDWGRNFIDPDLKVGGSKLTEPHQEAFLITNFRPRSLLDLGSTCGAP